MPDPSSGEIRYLRRRSELLEIECLEYRGLSLRSLPHCSFTNRRVNPLPTELLELVSVS